VFFEFVCFVQDYVEDLFIEVVYGKIKDHLDKEITIDSISRNRKNESTNNIQLTGSQKEKIYKLFEKDFKVFSYEK